jgi:hypothetical protein
MGRPRLQNLSRLGNPHFPAPLDSFGGGSILDDQGNGRISTILLCLLLLGFSQDGSTFLWRKRPHSFCKNTNYISDTKKNDSNVGDQNSKA